MLQGLHRSRSGGTVADAKWGGGHLLVATDSGEVIAGVEGGGCVIAGVLEVGPEGGGVIGVGPRGGGVIGVGPGAL